jgi:hypothetical protein
MSAFEFFFSLFGLILGLAIATIAGGMSDVLRERKRIPIGWLTPLMADDLPAPHRALDRLRHPVVRLCRHHRDRSVADVSAQ